MYGKPTGPVYSGSGMNVIHPVALIVTTPCGTMIVCPVPGVIAIPLIDVTFNMCQSASVSFPRRSNEIAMFAFVDVISSSATGGVLMMLICTVDESVFPFVSTIVYGKVTGPV